MDSTHGSSTFAARAQPQPQPQPQPPPVIIPPNIVPANAQAIVVPANAPANPAAAPVPVPVPEIPIHEDVVFLEFLDSLEVELQLPVENEKVIEVVDDNTEKMMEEVRDRRLRIAHKFEQFVEYIKKYNVNYVHNESCVTISTIIDIYHIELVFLILKDDYIKQIDDKTKDNHIQQIDDKTNDDYIQQIDDRMNYFNDKVITQGFTKLAEKFGYELDVIVNKDDIVYTLGHKHPFYELTSKMMSNTNPLCLNIEIKYTFSNKEYYISCIDMPLETDNGFGVKILHYSHKCNVDTIFMALDKLCTEKFHNISYIINVINFIMLCINDQPRGDASYINIQQNIISEAKFDVKRASKVPKYIFQVTFSTLKINNFHMQIYLPNMTEKQVAYYAIETDINEYYKLIMNAINTFMTLRNI
jgi:hypothetical protein